MKVRNPADSAVTTPVVCVIPLIMNATRRLRVTPIPLLLLPLLLHGTAHASSEAISVTGLSCEYLTNPLGIDILRPRLSWKLASAARGARQSAYRILAASTPGRLAHHRGDLWDSGRVESDRSIQIPYGGKELGSYVHCWWKVRVWDGAGRSAWSAPAHWSMGILHPREWRAAWIGYAAPTPKTAAASDLSGASWIWFPEGDPAVQAPAGLRYFRRSFSLPESVSSARVLITADNRFRLYVNGAQVGQSSSEGDSWHTPVELNITPRLTPGTNVLAVEAQNDAPSPAGVLASLVVRFKTGRPVTIQTGAGWRSSDQLTAGWQQPAFDDRPWQQAKVLGPAGMQPWGTLNTPGSGQWPAQPPAPLLRKSFTIRKPVRRAAVSVCGLGYYELHLNGAKVGDHELDPAFTRYDRRALYVTYDVTNRLKRGRNALGVILGNGFYNQYSRDAWNFQNAAWRDHPKLLLQLRIEYRDGSTETVASDGSWRASVGPIVHDGIRNGEMYDARLEKTGWDRPDYADRGWARASAVAPPGGPLRAQMEPPIRVVQTLRPVKVTRPKAGMYVFDMGQAFAGRARLHVRGAAGTKVTLRYGERLRPDGTVSRDQIQTLVYEGPFQTETYVLKGGGDEVWESRFTYHGYRYVEVTGFPGRPTARSLEGRVMHTDFPTTGSFFCSNPLLNAIQRLTLWSYWSNFVGIPTDCPHREKNGWTGDAQLASEQAMYNFDNAAAYTKWLNDFQDCQQPNGDFPGIVPTYDWGYGTGPAWDSAFFIIPWYLYLYRTDTSVLGDHYAAMKRYVDYLTRRAKDGIVDYGLGDWVPWKTVTPAAVTSTAYYYVDTQILAKSARLLGKAEDAKLYSRQAANIRRAFQKAFRHDGGVYANGSQTALSCALYQGLADPSERVDVLKQLVSNLQQQGDHLDTGILGARYVLHALSDNGQQELAYRVATQTTKPSYGDWVKRGATTLWEDWNGDNSLDHIMFGDISGWFYQELAGIHIDPEHPAFKHSILRPRPVPGLQWVRCTVLTPYGRLISSWRKENGQFLWDVVVPPNTSAAIWLPYKESASLLESGVPLLKSKGVISVHASSGIAVAEVTAGRYHFSTR